MAAYRPVGNMARRLLRSHSLSPSRYNPLGCGKCLQTSAADFSTNSNDQNPTTQVQPQRINRRTELDFEELRALQLSGDIALIDVRHPTELENYGEIPGAVKIPLCEVKNALQLTEDQFYSQFQVEKPAKHDRNLIFYARGPNASVAAVEIAHRLGFKRSRHYIGGWEEYSKYTGQPLKKPQKAESFGALNVYQDEFNQFFL